jgi:hypothetical protein
LRHHLTKIGPCLLLALAVASPSVADVIDFEAQTVAVGGNLTGIPDSPLTIGIATFTGGELLNGEIGVNADQSGVYATEGLFGSGETDPLEISFASPVDDLSVYVVNVDDTQSYTVSDNLDDSVTISLPSANDLGAATFSLPGKGITTVDITSADFTAWDFSIDNVSFTTTTPVPEPASLLLLVAGFIPVVAQRRKQLAARLHRNNQ